MADHKQSVKNTHPDYSANLSKWQRCRDVAAGEDAVHAAGTRYLPKLGEELEDDYKARRNRTAFFNAYWRTVAGLRGMLFRKPAQIEAPAGLLTYFDDIDMAGTPLQTFAQALAEEALIVGRVGILVDYPQGVTEGVTVAQASVMGLRPSLQMYKAESIINWRTERIGNVTKSSLFVLSEQVSIPGGEFEHKTETRYRVLDLLEGTYRQRVFRINERGDDEQVGADIFPLMNNQPMDSIPFIVVGVDSAGTKVELPPLDDLASMNLKHYQVSADYEHGCHFSGLPTLFISGYQPDTAAPKIYIGGPSANCLPDPAAKAYYAEVSGNFSALKANLDDKKAQMAVLGARMLEAAKAGVESGDAIARHQSGEQSMLAGMAQTLSQGIEQALTIFAEWAGQAAEITYTVNRDFAPAGMTAQDMTALVSAWQAGSISHETLFDNLKRGEIISEETLFEDEQARIGDSAPMLTAPMSGDPAGSNQPAAQEMQPMDMSVAKTKLQQAIDRHMRHLNGTEPTDDVSQQKMMDEMQAAKAAMDNSPQSAQDIQPIIDAIKAMPAPVITVEPVINVAAPDLTAIADAIKSIPAPIINVAAPVVSEPQQIQPIVLNTGTGGKVISFIKDSAGKISGATVKEQ